MSLTPSECLAGSEKVIASSSATPPSGDLVFSKNRPVLAFNDLKDRTDEDEQEGMMHLFMGAVLALRNPRVHTLLDDSPEVALEYIAFISMLAKHVDQAKRTT